MSFDFQYFPCFELNRVDNFQYMRFIILFLVYKLFMEKQIFDLATEL